jgi:triosephosphate isomerase
MVPEGVQVIIAPPAVLLSEFANASEGSSIELAAQNVATEEAGAYTGEISAPMLKDVACVWSLVGHSERRSLYGETDSDVVAKISQLLKVGLKPVLCVGETLDEREAGRAQEVVNSQVDAVLGAFTAEQLAELVIAYEPVWAIGTGKTATPEQAQEMHAAIRKRVESKSIDLASEMAILYGGSVNTETAEELFSQNDIDGGLVGGASLKVGDFLQICKSAG